MAVRQGGNGAPPEWDESSGRETKIIRALKDVDPSRPGTEHQLAILFSDIVGSTRYFEEHGDAEGLRMVQRIHELLRPAVKAHAGRVVKTIGDGMMAVFGSPRDALEAAHEMQLALRAANAKDESKKPIRIRIGLHHGRVLVDAKGDVFGDVVNVAARIQARAEPDQILVGESIQQRLEDVQALRSVGAFQPRGRSSGLHVFELPWKPPESRTRSSGLWILIPGIIVAGCLAGIAFNELRRPPEPFVLPPAIPLPRSETPEAPSSSTEAKAPEQPARKETSPEGRLTLITFPEAEVWLGRRHLGHTPVFNLALPEGVHRLQLVGTDKKKRTLSVTVRHSRPLTLKLKLADIPLAR